MAEGGSERKEDSRRRDRDREWNRERHGDRDSDRRSERDRSSDDKNLRDSDRRLERERSSDRENHRDRGGDSRRQRKEREGKQRESEERDKGKKARKREDREKEREREREEREREERERARAREERESASEKHREHDRKRQRRECEEELEEEQRKEMDKRRRRVQQWRELKRMKEEQEKEIAILASKNWTLEGESDDDEAVATKPEDDSKPNAAGEDDMAVDTKNGNGEPNKKEVDPLEAYMHSLLPEVEKLSGKENQVKSDDNNTDLGKKIPEESHGNRNRGKKDPKSSVGRILPGESDSEDLDNDEVLAEDENAKKTKGEKLPPVDHSKIQYPPFRKNFYTEMRVISRMTIDDVAAYRKQLELKIHGKDVPKPVKTWNQTGLTNKILDTIKKLGFEKPMPIQAQTLPIIMSGRDCIGVAKTGSGKTLAFVLPMLRHIKDQPPVVAGDGPIGLIMAPTRELVQQIHGDIKKFSKAIGIDCVAVYGGSDVAQQISNLKRGAEIVVCTPGRMIDILCTSSGKISNLQRVTYLVMDEADRMFDMGFEPQITRIVRNTRPDRQTVLFSATFPHKVEILARRVLNKPVEIQVGGRSVVNKDITQLVEVRQESERFGRLVELLREWCKRGKILIFVHSRDRCDFLFNDLIKNGYRCLSLHGAKDQTERESTIANFKSNACNLMIATSIAARGLDVKELVLVVNFDVPNHYEDYVHRVGRTGRAGRKGCAITFVSEEDARYTPDLVKALKLSEQAVPEELKALADGFMAKVNQGMEQAHGTGYGGSGFKFNEEEDEAIKAAKKAQAKDYGFVEDKPDSDSEDEGGWKVGGDIAQAAAISIPLPITSAQVLTTGDPAARVAAIAAALNLQHKWAKIQAGAMHEHYEAEVKINDFPQNARWKITHKGTLGQISEWTGAAITTRGQYYPPGKIVGPGDCKLYLFIEGHTESSVKKAKAEVQRVLEDCAAQALSLSHATPTVVMVSSSQRGFEGIPFGWTDTFSTRLKVHRMFCTKVVQPRARFFFGA